MLLACFAWLLHITPLLTPLWNDNASLGHGICIELAPIVSASHEHDRHTQHHSDPHTTVHSLSTAPAPTIMVSVSTSDMPSLNPTDEIPNQDHDAKQHNSCDICTAMSAVITPNIIKQTDSTLIELTTAIAMRWSNAEAYYSSRFLRPYLRAPPLLLLI